MFFLLRSAACIGVVFCMLPDSGGSPALHDLAADGGRLVAGEAQRYCTTNPDCLRAGLKLTAAAFAMPSEQGDATGLVTAAIAGKVAVVGSGKGRPKPKG